HVFHFTLLGSSQGMSRMSKRHVELERQFLGYISGVAIVTVHPIRINIMLFHMSQCVVDEFVQMLPQFFLFTVKMSGKRDPPDIAFVIDDFDGLTIVI